MNEPNDLLVVYIDPANGANVQSLVSYSKNKSALSLHWEPDNSKTFAFHLFNKGLNIDL